MVTGSGCSGTRFINNVFNNLGIHCEHEKAFNRGGFTYWREGQQGESSGYATPFLEGHEVIVLHQTRHPTAVIRSHRGRGCYLGKGTGGSYKFNHIHVGDACDEGPTHWLEWNKLVERYKVTHQYYRYQIERIDEELPKLLAILGVSVDPYWIDQAIIKADRCPAKGPIQEISYDYGEYPEFVEKAKEYGYIV